MIGALPVGRLNVAMLKLLVLLVVGGRNEGGGLDLLYRLPITKGGCPKSVTPRRSHVQLWQALPGSEHSIIVIIIS